MVAFMTLRVPEDAPLLASGTFLRRSHTFTIGFWLEAKRALTDEASTFRWALHPAVGAHARVTILALRIAKAITHVFVFILVA